MSGGSNVPPALTVQANGVAVLTDQYMNGLVQGGALLPQIRSFTGLSGMNVWMLGFAVPNDGGQGMFYWNASAIQADDGGVTTIQPNGALYGRWIRQDATAGAAALVTNIASLRAATSRTFSAAVAYVEGYYTGADGGEGMFWYASTDTSSADNGGTIIVDASNRRWYRETGGDPYSVKWFGATGNGATDDTSAIQSTVTSLPAAGGEVFFPAGTYKTSSAVAVVNSNISLAGVNNVASVIAPSSATANVFNFSGQFYEVSDLGVIPSVTSTGGVFFNFADGNVWLHRVFTNGGWSVLRFNGGAQTFVSDCLFDNFHQDGIAYTSGYGGLATLNNIEMNCSGGTNSGSAIICLSGDTFTWDNVHSQGCSTGAYIQTATSGSFIRNIFATNVLMDGAGSSTSAGSRWLINNSIGTDVQRVHLTNCWAGAGPSHGFEIFNVQECVLTACIAVDNARHGFLLTGTGNNAINLNGCTATGNSATSTGTYDGVHVDSGVSGFTIANGFYLPIGSAGATQGWGINIGTGASDHYVITGNQLWGNPTGALYNGGTGGNTYVAGNLTS